MTKQLALTSAQATAQRAAAKRLKKRRAAERRFKRYGQFAIGFAVAALLLVTVSIIQMAASAFTRHYVVFDLTLDANEIAPDGIIDSEAIASNVSGFNALIQADLRQTFPRAADDRVQRRDLYGLVTRLAVLPLARTVAENPMLLDTVYKTNIALSDNMDLFLKGGLTEREDIIAGQAGRLSQISPLGFTLSDAGPDGFPALRQSILRMNSETPSAIITLGEARFHLDRLTGAAMQLTYLAGALPDLGEQNGAPVQALVLNRSEVNRSISDHQIAWTMLLQEQGRIERKLNTSLLFNADSTYPELAGAAAAIMGSLFTMLFTALFALPVGVLAAIYLEEFAKTSRLTRLIKVNINNLAAVPSIIFGLLGAAVFLNLFGMPRSVPLVGGLVLALLVLPTVIIASRAALQAVPPSVRTAALGIGASKTQAVFHHVLPLAAPGMLTGAIIAMARALGETAPLLLIGMVAFVNEIPSGPHEEATVLPVLIFKWFSGAERAWEPMTAMVIILLLIFLTGMNLTAVLLRRRFEKRW